MAHLLTHSLWRNRARSLHDVGVILYPSNAMMAIASAFVASRGTVKERIVEKWGGLVG